MNPAAAPQKSLAPDLPIRYKPRTLLGSVRRMPGAFVRHVGRLAAGFRHRSVADEPAGLELFDRAASD